MSYLREGLPAPSPDGLDAPYWSGLGEEVLRLQRCRACQRFQWGPEWMCHRCLSFDLDFEAVAPRGSIYSFERVWHPVHPALKDQGAYLIVLVSLSHADDVRLVGNLLGDPLQPVSIGAPVQGVFEHHPAAASADPRDSRHPRASRGAFTLLQWQLK